MYLHEDKKIFKEIIEKVHESKGLSSGVIEKDYYVTMLLKLISEKGKKLGLILNELLDCVIEDPSMNEKETLLNVAKKLN